LIALPAVSHLAIRAAIGAIIDRVAIIALFRGNEHTIAAISYHREHEGWHDQEIHTRAITSAESNDIIRTNPTGFPGALIGTAEATHSRMPVHIIAEPVVTLFHSHCFAVTTFGYRSEERKEHCSRG
jgi:hypothetical protein